MLQKRIIKYLFIALLGIPFLISCIPQKRLVLLQKKDKKDSAIFPVTKHIYRLDVGDNIYITVTGIDQKTAGLFNMQAGNYLSRGQSMNYQYSNYRQTPGMYLWSYTINDSGFINFPLINRIYLKGKTLRESQKIIQDSINQYANYTTAVIKYVSFQVNVLGEVKEPGMVFVNGEYFSLLDAISITGDFNEYANRNKVRIVRNTDHGNQIAFLDLTDEKILSSEYYYLRPGDVIYVPPMAAKSFGLRSFQLSTFLSLISSALLLYNALKL